MKRCWLHIGMPKTGSTSIQVYLDKRTKRDDWEYVSMGGAASTNREMHAMFGTRPEKWYWFAKRGESREKITVRGERMRAELSKAIRDSDKRDIILSSESLSMIEKPGIVALHGFLKQHFDEIRVLAYVRPPIGFMTSFFQQRVKAGHGVFDFKSTLPCYRKRFRKFDAVFGRKNVILRKFDPSAFPDGCIVADFCGQVGIDPPAKGEVKRVNESLSREACGILYAYHKFGPGYGVGRNVIKENNRIIAPLLAMGGRKFKVSRAVASDWVDLEDLAWMERRLGMELAEHAAEDGSEVKSEEDLLLISRASCLEFAANFQKMYGVAIPADVIPGGDPADPQAVADMIARARRIIRKLHRKDSSGPRDRPGLLGRIKSIVGRAFK